MVREIAMLNDRVAIVGYGYWGSKLARVFSSIAPVLVYDTDEKSRAAAAKAGFELALSFEEAVVRSKAVVLAVPLSSHYSLGRQVLASGKHLLLEKPMTERSQEALNLCLMLEPGQVLLIDHTFLFNEQIRFLGELLGSGDLGEPLALRSYRLNLGRFRSETDVIWELAVHDFAILNYLFAPTSCKISCHGKTHLGKSLDTAEILVETNDSIDASFQVSWLAPTKRREVVLIGSKIMAVAHDVGGSVVLYRVDLKEDENGKVICSREEHMDEVYRLPVAEPLKVLAEHFLQLVDGKKPITGTYGFLSDGIMGYNVIRQLEAASRSNLEGGSWQTVDWEMVGD